MRMSGAFLPGLFDRRCSGLEVSIPEWCSAVSRSTGKKRTLRAMHYQASPYTEAKLVRCTKGAIYDVIIDLRADSPTFKRWVALEMTAENRLILFIPEGFAHGLQTLEDNSEVFYQMSEFFHPECARGLRWDDPAFGIKWPLQYKVISAKDQSYEDLDASKACN